MSAQHTPGGMIAVGPWVENIRDDKPDLVTSEGIGGDTDKEQCANARRIAACWNAFDGMKTDIIEVVASMGGINPGVLFDVKQQRDELLEALRRIEGADLSMYTSRSGMLEDCQNIARAAIAKMEGGAA